MNMGSPLNVIVVEDDAMLRRSVMDMLGDLGHVGVAAPDGAVALRLLESRRAVQVMMVDVKLPGMDGRDLANIARGLRSDLRFVFATGYGSRRLGSMMSDPLARYLPKPYRLNDLEDALNSLRIPSGPTA